MLLNYGFFFPWSFCTLANDFKHNKGLGKNPSPRCKNIIRKISIRFGGNIMKGIFSFTKWG
jgi:hypothetical protein